jgi:Dolichyl-phosphate-mannose-protein mannosyltransferase
MAADAQVRRPGRSSRLVLIVAAALLGIAVLSLVQLFHREFTVFLGDYTHVDEIFFAVCATRGLAFSDPLVPGCHDNKAPLVYTIYQLVEWASGRYSIAGIKLASVLLVVASLGMVAWVARRIAGNGLAALLAAALAAQVLAVDPGFLALKLELIGTLFLLGGIALLLRWQRGGSPWLLLFAGFVFGLAVMTKQTFALAVFGVVGWLLISGRHGAAVWGRRVAEGLLFAFGTALPLGCFALFFWRRDELSEFAGSVVLHAAAYGAGGLPTSMSERAWKLGWFVHQFGLVFPLTLLFIAALCWWGSAQRPQSTGPLEQRGALGLLFVQAVAMALVPVLAKQYFPPHLLPAWLLMSIPAAVVAAGWLQGLMQAPPTAMGTYSAWAGVGLVVAVVMAVNSWYLNGDAVKRRLSQQHQLDPGSRISGAAGSYGYVLGVRPEFYFFNGIVPASDVLYPAGLAGAGSTPRARGSAEAQPLLVRAHAFVQAQAEQRLMAQFRQTPPEHIFLVDKWARAPGSTAATDVLLLDVYIALHCEQLRVVEGKPYQQGVLYRCARPDEDSRSDVLERRRASHAVPKG